MLDLKNFNVDLIRKYEEKKSPYYTSYPTGGQWTPSFKNANYKEALKNSIQKGQKVPLALYVHFPFCPELCYFCCCIKTISKNEARIENFLSYLHREIDIFIKYMESLGAEPDVREIHLGGGTPTYMKKHQYEALLSKLGSIANLKKLEEFTLEVDPRTATKDDMAYYLYSGVNRLSFGIQDFNPKTQKAVNRVQPYEMIVPLISGDTRCFSVSFDLIYGLPFSTIESFKETIRLAKQLNPDRLAVYNYDHTPEIHSSMRAINTEDLPSLEEKTLMYAEVVNDLLESGYSYVGVDHFAKPSDKLAQAYEEKKIWRNLNGYTTYRNYNFEIGLGSSSIGSFNQYYAQNMKSELEYFQSIDNDQFPVLRGFELSPDDIIRREVIFTILCHHYLDYSEIEQKFKINFKEYFKENIPRLDGVVQDGFAEIGANFIRITPLGKLFVHHVCKSFDKYLTGTYVRIHEAIMNEQTVQK